VAGQGRPLRRDPPPRRRAPAALRPHLVLVERVELEHEFVFVDQLRRIQPDEDDELDPLELLRGGLQTLMSYALQRAEDVDTGKRLVNSPQQIAKARFSVPGPSRGSFLSVEALSLGSRQTIGGNTLKPATTASITAVVPIRNAFEIVGTLRHLFDVQYADPASDSHRQDSIPQNGRTLRIGLRWKLGAK
jgi:hypothetical protein